jgi:hypothetical protein
MNFEPILKIIADAVNGRLSEVNPWKNRVWTTVEDPKEGGNTWAVVELQSEPREIVVGNATMQAAGRLYAQIVPTEGDWSADIIMEYADALSDALCTVVDEWILPSPSESGSFVVLGLNLTGAVRMRADREVGYTVEQPFLLTVQF